MSDLDLGKLTASLALRLDQLDADVKKAVAGLASVERSAEKTTSKTEDLGKTLKSALKGEVLASSLARMGQGLRELDGQFSGLTRSIEGAGVVLQGLFAGGVAGGVIAAIGFGVSTIAAEWGKAQEATEKAAAAVRENYKKSIDETIASIAKLDTRIAAARRATEDKTDLTTAAGRIGVEGADARLREAAGQRDPVQSQLDQLQADLKERREELDLLPVNGRNQAARAAVGNVILNLIKEIAEVEKNLAPLNEAYEAARLKFEEASKTVAVTKAETGVAAAPKSSDPVTKLKKSIEEQIRLEKDGDKAAKLAAMLDDKDPAKLFAFEEKQRLDEWTKALGRMVDPDGSRSTEERERAARNAGYAANAAQTVMLDDPDEAKRRAAEKERLTRQAQDPVASFREDADNATTALIGELFFFEDMARALGDGIVNASNGLKQSIAAITDGFNAGGLWGAIGSFAVLMIQKSKQFGWVTNMIDGAMQRIADSFGKLIEPLVPLADVLITVVAGLVDLIIGPIAAAFEALAPVIYEFAKGIAWVYNGINGAIASMLEWVAGFAIGDLKPFAFLGDWAKEMREKTIALPPTYDAYIDSLDKASASADKVAQSFLNLPAGFKTASAIYDATSASSAAFGGYAPPAAAVPLPAVSGGAAATGPTGGGDVFNFYGPINVHGDGEFVNVVTVSARQSDMATSGTARPATQRPTPRAPNATQPYTPATP